MPTKEKTRDNCSTNNISCLSLVYILSLVLIYEKDVERQMKELQETLDLLKYKCWYYEMAIQDQSEERVRSLSAEELPEEYKKIKNHIQSV